MKNIKQRLKPCPFCGCEKIIIIIASDFISHKDIFYVKCADCEAQSGSSATRNEVEDKWQVRN